MHKITVGIADDEQKNREYISTLIRNEFPFLDIIFEAGSIHELSGHLRSEIPDILFLEAGMEGGAIFNFPMLENLPCQKILLSSYDRYALKAIKAEVLDYLMKPLLKPDLVNAATKAIHRIQEGEHLKNVLRNATQSSTHVIDLPTSSGYKRVELEHIIWCEADASYTNVHLCGKKTILVSKPLGAFEELLAENGFFRIHHKTLINLAHYQEYIKGKSGHVVMSDGTTLDISARRKPDFLQLLKHL